MPRRGSSWWNERSTKKLMRKPGLLGLMKLEDRTTPDGGLAAFVGPVEDFQLTAIENLGLTAFSPLATLPDSPVDANSYFDLARFNAFSINTARLNQLLPDNFGEPVTLAIPRPDGAFDRFQLSRYQLLSDDFAAARPDVSTYRGLGVDDPNAVLVADMTPAGFRAMVLSPNGVYFVDPYYHLDQSVSVSYFKHDNRTDKGSCGCPHCQGVVMPDQIGTFGMGGGPVLLGPSPAISLGANLRTFRTAVAATGEYTAFHGGTVTGAQNAIITTMNRVSGVYEKDLAIKLELINNTTIIYTNASTDPFTNNDGATMLTENQNNMTSVVGSANYDIGHVFSTGGGGIAGLGVVGSSANKARGVTGSSSPTGDSFDIDYVAHEMGHQFGANHTFNGTQAGGNRNAATAWEPGSGSTIMAYAGIMGVDDLQPNSDAYFHIGSIGEIRNFLNTIPSVGTTTASGNTPPTVSAGLDYTIPANTPFALTGSATDLQGNPITYNWEQYDAVSGSSGTPLGTYPSTNQALFRSFNSTTSPTRTFPRLPNLLNNTSSTAELMPTTSRPLNFTLTARDTRAMTGPTGGVIGGISSDDMLVTVVNTGAAFTVTAPNTAVTWQGGSTQTVTWNVAGTTGNGINAANVNILLSTDGGNTFPITVLANTANDGSETIIVPNNASSSARIKVVPTNNIFFDISNANFTITPGTGMQVNSTSPAVNGIFTGPTASLDLTFSQPINASTLQASDLVLSTGLVTGVTMPDANTARFSILNLLPESTLTATLASGAVTSTTGNATAAFSGTYAVDITETPFTGSLTARNPLGSRVYTGTMTGSINLPGDEDTYTLDLDPGQTFSISVIPNSTLRPIISATGPSTLLTATATTLAKAVNLVKDTVTGAGTFSFKVAGATGTIGSYTLQVTLNSAIESESIGGDPNNTIATAQNISTALTSLGASASFGSILGSFDGGTAATDTEPNNTTAAAVNAANTFGTYTGNLYHLGLTGELSSTSDQDYFNIGTLQAGDVITISQMGAGSGAGTLTDPFVYLYRNGTTGILASNDDDGPVNDSLIYRYTIPTTDTYFIRAEVFNNSASGTYRLGVQLENTGTAPTTGGTVFAESAAANDTKATAQNVSNSWQAPTHTATASGTITSGDLDYYAYTLSAGDLLTLNARSTSTLDAEVRLLNSAGTQLVLEDGSSVGPNLDSPIYAFRVATAGTYYVEVAAAAGTGTYTLDAFLATATTPPSALDHYSLSLAAGQSLNLVLKGTSGSNTLELLNNLGAVVATSVAGASNVDRSIANYVVPSAGTYYARLSGTNPSAYVLTAGLNAAFDTEPNDTFAAAINVSTNPRIAGYLASGNEDWYSVDLVAGNTFTILTSTPFDAANAPANLLNPRVELYSPSNVLLASNSNGAADGRNALLSFNIIASGPYKIRILPELGTSGEYETALSQAPSSLGVLGFTLNNAATQRSRVTSIEVQFSQAVTPGDFTGDGDITLTRYAATSAGTIGTVVKTGAVGPNGFINVTQGTANSLILSFMNADGSPISAGVEYGSLADGRWRLSIPEAFNYQNPIGADDPIIRRLFGDIDNNGTVDSIDFGPFGSTFGLGSSSGPNFNPAFDFNANNDIDAGTDLAEFGNRFGITL